MNTKLLGGVLLVVGTSIGGGMLVLPVACAGGGFVSSTMLLIACWLMMMIPALLVLEVNLWLPSNSNIISMAKATLGRFGAIVSWIAYLLLLYTLLSAYISSGTDVMHDLLSLIHVDIPLWLASCLFTLVLGFIVYKGIESVDYVNRGLMSAKLLAYVLLVGFTLPYVKIPNLLGGQPSLLINSMLVLITSFGFATIVPSLRNYFHDDIAQLHKLIFIGSAAPLICYILWNLAIIGSLPRTGPDSLMPMLDSASSTSDLVNALSSYLHNQWVTDFAHFFVSICVMTSFLAVSLGLTDFLSDGLKTSKKGKGAIIVYGFAFLPPLIIVLFDPGLFIKGLNYAGICCVLLLMLLPVLMAWRGRYILQMAKGYQVWGGKPLLFIMMIISLIVLSLSIVGVKP